MFDKRINLQFPSEINIKENRAPTDDSIRLYDEYQQKAFKSIIDSFQCRFNELHCTVVRSRAMDAFGEYFIVKFNLNGSEFEFKHLIPDIDTHSYAKIADNMKLEFAKFLVQSLLKNCDFKDLTR